MTVCERFLTEVPTDVSLLSVLVDDTAYQPGPDTWVYVSPSETTPGPRGSPVRRWSSWTASRSAIS